MLMSAQVKSIKRKGNRIPGMRSSETRILPTADKATSLGDGGERLY
jgi:hypothetical protein